MVKENTKDVESMMEGVFEFSDSTSWEEIKGALQDFVMDNYFSQEFGRAVGEGYPYNDEVFDEEGCFIGQIDWLLMPTDVRMRLLEERGKTP